MLRRRGFTLIELLVVIAIIGILSAVVLASLNTARQKGDDAAIQSDLSTIQTEAEIYYGRNNSYGIANSSGSCIAPGTMFYNSSTGDKVIANALLGAKGANGNGIMRCYVNSTGTAYAVQAQLVTDSTRTWCVDSTGASSKSTTALTSTTIYCSASN